MLWGTWLRFSSTSHPPPHTHTPGAFAGKDRRWMFQGPARTTPTKLIPWWEQGRGGWSVLCSGDAPTPATLLGCTWAGVVAAGGLQGKGVPYLGGCGWSLGLSKQVRSREESGACPQGLDPTSLPKPNFWNFLCPSHILSALSFAFLVAGSWGEESVPSYGSASLVYLSQTPAGEKCPGKALDWTKT